MEDQFFDMMRFDLPREQSSIIKVIGVGGGGSNAVNYMYEQGIKGVDFIVCNTDSQALDSSPVPIKIQLGETLTMGRGAGSIPEVGRNAAVENLDDVKAIIGGNTTMVFVTAGMGGGTGTGAAPVIARAAREMGILTVGIVTIPFVFEGKRRGQQAEDGLEEMREAVDTLLVIRNDKLRELYGNLPLKRAFDHADEVLCTAAKGIAEVITLTGEINVDMNDVNTVMRNSGVAIMGSGKASGEGRAMMAVAQALESPLLNDNDITGANFVLLNITFGEDEVLMDEITEITDYIQERAGQSAEVIWGYGNDASLGSDLCVTVIATGFKTNKVDSGMPAAQPAVKKMYLPTDNARELVSPTTSPTEVSKPVSNIEEEPFLKVEAQETPNVPAAPVDPIISKEESSVEFTFDIPLKKEEQPQLFTEEDIDAADLNAIEEEWSAPEAKVEDNEIHLRNQEFDALRFEEKEKKQEESTPFRFLSLDGSEIMRNADEVTDSFPIAEQKREIEDDRPSRQELIARNREREQRVRELTMRLKSPSGINDLENEPAFMRRNITLDETPHSSESIVSKFSLSEENDGDGNKRAQLKEDNSYLHRNVD
jgi:cell division protein FtsZ